MLTSKYNAAQVFREEVESNRGHVAALHYFSIFYINLTYSCTHWNARCPIDVVILQIAKKTSRYRYAPVEVLFALLKHAALCTNVIGFSRRNDINEQ